MPRAVSSILVAIVSVVVVLVLGVGGASAQDTGGSIGGGDWGDSGGGGASGGDSSSGGGDSSDSYSYGNDDGGARSGGSGGGGVGVLLALVVLGVALAFMARREELGPAPYAYEPTPGPTAVADVTLLRVALDAGVRSHVQAELNRIARTCTTATAEGRTRTLAEIALMLRRLRGAWCYGGAANHPLMSTEVARRAFLAHATAARATFQRELVRHDQGQTTSGAPRPQDAPTEPGPGLVLVTLIVAARRELVTVTEIGDGEQLRRALEALSALTPTELMAIEIVWTPADPADRMSSIELEHIMSGQSLFKIDGALVGKVVCAHCGSLFPAEAVSCGTCGAPVRGARAA